MDRDLTKLFQIHLYLVVGLQEIAFVKESNYSTISQYDYITIDFLSLHKVEKEKCLAERPLRDLHNNDFPNVSTWSIDQGNKAGPLRTDDRCHYLNNTSRISLHFIVICFFPLEMEFQKKIILESDSGFIVE